MAKREEVIAKRLQGFEKEYRAGNFARFLDAMLLCLQYDHPIPRWAAGHFIWGAIRYETAEAWKLDDAFEVYRPKGRHQSHVIAQKTRGLIAHVQARALHTCKGVSVETAIREVAEKLHMSKATVERFYYDAEIMADLRETQIPKNTEDEKK